MAAAYISTYSDRVTAGMRRGAGVRSRRAARTAPLALIAALIATMLAGPAAAQDDRNAPGRFEDFSAQGGVIVVTGERTLGSDLFESVPVPETACLAAAPELGAAEPGFAIDGTTMRKVSHLEKLRRKTPAGTIFVTGGSFVGAELEEAELHDMCFFGTDFSQSDWREFSGSGIGFIRANLNGAQMAGARMPHILLRDVNLAEADARGANFERGRLDGGWDGSVRNLRLDGANLTGFRIVCGTTAEDGCPADRTGLSLTEANLRRASLYSFLMPDIDLAGAVIDQTELGLDHLARLEGARLAGPVIVRSDRRAVMLFPSEAEALGAVAGAGQPDAIACDAPETPAEQAVCAVPGSAMRALVREVAMLERRAGDTENYAEQRAQFAQSRDGCLTLPEEQRGSCLTAAYTQRAQLLRAVVGSPDWVEEPGYRLYLSSDAAFDTGGSSAPIFGRILPILLDRASSIVMLRIESEREIEAKGFGEGGCSFSVEGLRHNAEEDTLKPGGKKDAAPLLSLGGGELEVLAQGLAEAGSGCGQSGAFARMRHIALDDEMLIDLYANF